jgi:hypothetical protein
MEMRRVLIAIFAIALVWLGAAGPALAEDSGDHFPGSTNVWNCYPEVMHNCSAEDCQTGRKKPGTSQTQSGWGVMTRRLDLSAGTFTVCPNAVDGCDNFRINLDKGKSYSTVIGNDKGHYTIMRIRNRDGRFLRFSSLALVNWVSYGICTPAG